MANYTTKQRLTLLTFLEAHADELLSARQIADALKSDGVSMSAVYRNISYLEDNGKLRRHSQNGNREIYYQYIGADNCKNCLHLSCKKCGKTFHMKHENAAVLKSSLTANESFLLDSEDTVLYGICKNCH